MLEVLSLIDWALVGGLLGMRMRSGYERFLSRLDAAVEDGVRRGWLGKTDDTKLNKTLPWSLGALCSIHRPPIGTDASSTPNDKMMGYGTIHRTVVASAVGIGRFDPFTRQSY